MRAYIEEDSGTRHYVTARPEFSVWVDGQAQELIHNDSSTSAKALNKSRIQAALDWALNNKKGLTSLSAGKIYCDPGLYVDPPGNLRSTPSAPTIFNFSHELRGAGGLYNGDDHGTQLLFTDNTALWLALGTGQGMELSDLSLIGPSGISSRAAYPAGGIGVGLAGGNGGLSRALLRNVGVKNVRTAYKTGYNGVASLCDSVTGIKLVAFDCHTGWHASQTQNYIQTLLACDFGGNKIHVLSDVAKAVNIYGGNFSTANTWHKAFTISSVSGLSTFTDSTQIGDAPFTNATFTAVVSSPDQPLADGAYDAFVIDTNEFGPIALRLTNWNAGTSTATFSLYAWWLLGSGFDINFGGAFGTRLAAALSGATTLYACETITTFKGMSFNVDGVHVENPGCLTTFFHMFSGFGGDDGSRFNRVTFNYDLDHAGLHGGSADNEAVFMCQQAFPFIQMQSYNDIGGPDQAVVELSNITTAESTNRMLIDAIGRNRHRLIVRGCDLKPNLRTLNFTGGLASVIDMEVAQRGFGEWDETPFVAAADTQQFYSRRKFNGIPFHGYYPAEWAQPTIRTSHLADIEDGLGAVGTYPCLMGRTPYRVNYYDAYDAVGGLPASRWVESDHQFWSYGQGLSINWSYVAGSNVLRLSDTSRMFAGLRIILDNGGGDEFYVVTGVYAALGYVTVMRHRPGTGVSYLAGTAGTTYTGTTVKQEAYSLSRVGLIKNYTVAGLPSAATAGAGARAFVTDANSTTFGITVAGGGANMIPVYSDGSNWKIG